MRFSFKTRIVGVTVLASAAILAACAWLFFIQITNAQKKATDNQLLTLAEKQMKGFHFEDHWKRFSESLNIFLPENMEGEYVIRVIDKNREELYTHPKWPQNTPEKIRPFPEEDSHVSPRKHHRHDRSRKHHNDKHRSRHRHDRPKKHHNDEHPPPPSPQLLHLDGPNLQPIYTTVKNGTGTWRICSLINPHVELSIAVRVNAMSKEVYQMIRITAVGAPLLLCMMGFITWFMAHHSLRTVRRISSTASSITSDHLDARIPKQNDDQEFAQLIDIINEMLARLETSYQQATRFSSDASHELNTPLTILHGELEDALQHAPNEQTQQQMAALLEEVQHLKNITRKLLLLSKADTGQLFISKESINLSIMVEEIGGDIPFLDPEAIVNTTIQKDLLLLADKDLLRQAIQNLVNNALSYVLKSGSISLILHANDTHAYIAISNTSQPIPQDKLPHIFDRFFRIDSARTRGAHTGLGLSLVREIARAHGGTVECTKNEKGLVEFTLSIPLV